MSNELEKLQHKEKFLEGFVESNPDLFALDSWTDEQRAEVAEILSPSKMRTAMFASIPLRCHGPECPYHEVCPLYAVNLHPLNRSCPIEAATISQFMQNYVEELGVDPENLVEISMVRDLVDQEIQYLRKTKILAKEHFIQENVVGVDSEGKVIMKKELHMAVELEDRLHKRRKDLRNQLLATREARAKVGQGQVDTAKAIAGYLDAARELDAAKEKAMRTRLGKLYQDDYITDAEVVKDEGT